MSFWDQDPSRVPTAGKCQDFFQSDVLNVKIAMQDLTEMNILDWLWQLDIDGLRATDFAFANETQSFNDYELITNKQKKSGSSTEAISTSLLQYEPFIYQILQGKVETNIQYRIFEMLMETYNPAVNERETLSKEKLSLISIFLDSLLQTEVMKLAFLYIKHKLGYKYFNYQRFKGTLFYTWFALHTLIVVDPTVKKNKTPTDTSSPASTTGSGSGAGPGSRPGSASSTGSRKEKSIAKVQYSSAFEHIFVGEIQLEKTTRTPDGSATPPISSLHQLPFSPNATPTPQSTPYPNQSSQTNQPIGSLTLSNPQPFSLSTIHPQPAPSTTNPTTLRSPRSVSELIDLLSPHPNFNPHDLKMADEVLSVEQLVPHLFSKTMGTEFLNQNQYVQSFLTDLSFTFIDSDSSDEGSDDEYEGESNSNSNHHYFGKSSKKSKNRVGFDTNADSTTADDSSGDNSSSFDDEQSEYSDQEDENDYQEFRKSLHQNELLALIQQANLANASTPGGESTGSGSEESPGEMPEILPLAGLPPPTTTGFTGRPPSSLAGASSTRPGSRSPAMSSNQGNRSPLHVNQHPNDQGVNLLDDFKLYVQDEEQKAREKAQREAQELQEKKRKEAEAAKQGDSNSVHTTGPIDLDQIEADLYAGLTPEKMERRRKEQVWAQRAAKKAAKQAAAGKGGGSAMVQISPQERFLKRQEKIQRKYNQAVLNKQRTNGVVLGLHFWYTYALLERTRSISYLGHKYAKNSLTKLDAPFISLKFLWQIGNQTFLKDRGSFFVGCSPAFLMALSTVAFFEVQSVTDLGHFNANRYDLDYEYDNSTQMNINRKAHHQQLQSFKYKSSSRVPQSVFTTNQEFVQYTGNKTAQPMQQQQQQQQADRNTPSNTNTPTPSKPSSRRTSVQSQSKSQPQSLYSEENLRKARQNASTNSAQGSDDDDALTPSPRDSVTDTDPFNQLPTTKLLHLTTVFDDTTSPPTDPQQPQPYSKSMLSPKSKAFYPTFANPDISSSTTTTTAPTPPDTATPLPADDDQLTEDENDARSVNSAGNDSSSEDDPSSPDQPSRRRGTRRRSKKQPQYSDSECDSDYDPTATHPKLAHKKKKNDQNDNGSRHNSPASKLSNRALQRQYQEELDAQKRARRGSRSLSRGTSQASNRSSQTPQGQDGHSSSRNPFPSPPQLNNRSNSRASSVTPSQRSADRGHSSGRNHAGAADDYQFQPKQSFLHTQEQSQHKNNSNNNSQHTRRPSFGSRDASPAGSHGRGTRSNSNNSNNAFALQMEEEQAIQEMEFRQHQLEQQRLHHQPQLYERDVQVGGGERAQIGLGWAVLPSVCSNFITRRVIDGYVYEIIVCKEKDFLVSVYNNLIGKADANGDPE